MLMIWNTKNDVTCVNFGKTSILLAYGLEKTGKH